MFTYKNQSWSLLTRRGVALGLVFLMVCPTTSFPSQSSRLYSGSILPNLAPWGRVEETYQSADAAKKIIFIQDAHDSLEAQLNTARIISQLIRKSGVKTVYEEGYEGQVPTEDYFGFIRDKQLKKKAAFYLMDHLRLGGAEFLHVLNPQAFDLIGADNFKLHHENIRRYGESKKIEPVIQDELRQIDAEYQKIMNINYPRAVSEWLKEWQRAQDGQLSFDQYCLRLAKKMRAAFPGKNPFESYPQFAALLSLLESPQSNVKRNIQPAVLFAEIKSSERDFVARQLASETDRRIFTNYQLLQSIKKVAALKAAPEEFEWVSRYVFASEPAAQPASIALSGFSQRAAADAASVLKKPVVYLAAWEKLIDPAMEFYLTAEKRDAKLARILESNPSSAPQVLVYGGFHRKRICELLRRLGYSYSVVTPSIKNVSPKHQKIYETLMTARRLPGEPLGFAHSGSRPEPIFDFPRNEVRDFLTQVLPALRGETRRSKMRDGGLSSAVGLTPMVFNRSEMRLAMTDIETVGDKVRALLKKNPQLPITQIIVKPIKAESPEQGMSIAFTLNEAEYILPAGVFSMLSAVVAFAMISRFIKVSTHELRGQFDSDYTSSIVASITKGGGHIVWNYTKKDSSLSVDVETVRSEMRDIEGEPRVIDKTEAMDALDFELHNLAKQRSSKENRDVPYLRVRLRDDRHRIEVQYLATVQPDGTRVPQMGLIERVVRGGGILFFDTEGADARALEQFNALFDAKPFLGSSATPADPRLQVFVGIHPKEADHFSITVYSRALQTDDQSTGLDTGAFHSEFDRLMQDHNQLREDAVLGPNDAVIDLMKRSDFQDILVEHIGINGQGEWEYQEGPLVKAMNGKKRLVIQGPRNDPDFRYFIDQILVYRTLIVNGQVIQVPPDFEIVFQQKDYSRLSEPKTIHLGHALEGDVWMINQVTKDILFQRVEIDARTNRLRPLPGILAQKNVKIRITENLEDEGIWNAIMHTPGVQVEVAAGVEVPFVYSHFVAMKPAAVAEPEEATSDLPEMEAGSVHLLEADDLPFLTERIRAANPAQKVTVQHMSLGSSASAMIDTGELMSVHDKYFEIRNVKQKVLAALEAGETVILEGVERSPRLMKELESLFSDVPYLIVNGERKNLSEFKGKLILTATGLNEGRSRYEYSTRIAKSEDQDALYFEQLKKEFPTLAASGKLNEKWNQLKQLRDLFKNLPLPSNRGLTNELFPSEFDWSYARLKVYFALLQELQNPFEAFQHTWGVHYRRDAVIANYIQVQAKIMLGAQEAKRGVSGSMNSAIAGRRLNKILSHIRSAEDWHKFYWQMVNTLSWDTLEALRDELAEKSWKGDLSEQPLAVIKEAVVLKYKNDRTGFRSFLRDTLNHAGVGNLTVPLIDDELELDYLTADERLALVKKITQAVPIVFLQGAPGTGKSKLLPDLAQALGYSAEERFGPFTTGSNVEESELTGTGPRGFVGNWRKSLRGILLWDEANTAPADFHYFLLDNAGKNKPIVMTGNDETTEDRNVLRVAQERGVTVVFDDFDRAFYEAQAERYLAGVKDAEEIIPILMNMHEIAKLIGPQYEFSIREIQEASNRVKAFGLSASDQDKKSELIYQIWLVYRDRFSEVEQSAVQFIFQKKMGNDEQGRPLLDFKALEAKRLEATRAQFADYATLNDVALTGQTLSYLAYLWDLMRLRQARAEGQFVEPGKVSSLVLGPSGWGKDFVLENFLAEWQKRNPVSSASQAIHYLNGSMSDDELEATIQTAKADGSIIALREMNFLKSGVLEGKLNDILAGGKKPHPGFLFIGTLNGAHFSGRNKVSSPLMSRSSVFMARPYDEPSLLLITAKLAQTAGLAEDDTRVASIAHFQAWITAQVQNEEFIPTIRELTRAIQYLVKHPQAGWADAARFVYGPTYERWQLAEHSADFERLYAVSQLTENQPDTASVKQVAIYQKIVDVLSPPVINKIHVKINRTNQHSYFEHKDNALVISTADIATGRDWFFISMTLGMHAFTRGEYFRVQGEQSEKLFMQIMDSLFNERSWSSDANKGLAADLFDDVQLAWVEFLAGRIFSREPRRPPNSAIQLAHVIQNIRTPEGALNQDAVAVLFEWIENANNTLTPRKLYRYSLMAYLFGQVTIADLEKFQAALMGLTGAQNGDGDFFSLLGENPFPALLEHLKGDSYVGMPQSNVWESLTTQLDPDINGGELVLSELQIQFLQSQIVDWVESIVQNTNHPVPEVQEGDIPKEKNAPQIAVPDISQALAMRAEMDAQAKAEADRQTQERLRAKRQKNFNEKVADFDEAMTLIEKHLALALKTPGMVTFKRLDEIEDQIKNPARRLPGAVLVMLQNLRQEFQNPDEQQKLEKLNKRFQNALKKYERVWQRYKKLEEMARRYQQFLEEKAAREKAGEPEPESPPPNEKKQREMDALSRFMSLLNLDGRNSGEKFEPQGDIYSPEARGGKNAWDVDGPRGEIIKPPDEALVRVEAVNFKTVSITPTVEKPPEDPQLAKLRDQEPEIFENLFRAFFNWLMDTGRRTGGHKLDLSILLKTGNWDLARQTSGAVLKRLPRDLVIYGGGKLTALQADLFRFLFERGYSVRVLMNSGQISPRILSLQELMAALGMAGQNATLIDRDETARNLAREFNLKSPWLATLDDIQTLLFSGYAYAAVHAAIQHQKMDEEVKPEAAAAAVVEGVSPKYKIKAKPFSQIGLTFLVQRFIHERGGAVKQYIVNSFALAGAKLKTIIIVKDGTDFSKYPTDDFVEYWTESDALLPENIARVRTYATNQFNQVYELLADFSENKSIEDLKQRQRAVIDQLLHLESIQKYPFAPSIVSIDHDEVVLDLTSYEKHGMDVVNEILKNIHGFDHVLLPRFIGHARFPSPSDPMSQAPYPPSPKNYSFRPAAVSEKGYLVTVYSQGELGTKEVNYSNVVYEPDNAKIEAVREHAASLNTDLKALKGGEYFSINYQDGFIYCRVNVEYPGRLEFVDWISLIMLVRGVAVLEFENADNFPVEMWSFLADQNPDLFILEPPFPEKEGFWPDFGKLFPNLRGYSARHLTPAEFNALPLERLEMLTLAHFDATAVKSEQVAVALQKMPRLRKIVYEHAIEYGLPDILTLPPSVEKIFIIPGKKALPINVSDLAVLNGRKGLVVQIGNNRLSEDATMGEDPSGNGFDLIYFADGQEKIFKNQKVPFDDEAVPAPPGAKHGIEQRLQNAIKQFDALTSDDAKMRGLLGKHFLKIDQGEIVLDLTAAGIHAGSLAKQVLPSLTDIDHLIAPRNQPITGNKLDYHFRVTEPSEHGYKVTIQNGEGKPDNVYYQVQYAASDPATQEPADKTVLKDKLSKLGFKREAQEETVYQKDGLWHFYFVNKLSPEQWTQLMPHIKNFYSFDATNFGLPKAELGVLAQNNPELVVLEWWPLKDTATNMPLPNFPNLRSYLSLTLDSQDASRLHRSQVKKINIFELENSILAVFNGRKTIVELDHLEEDVLIVNAPLDAPGLDLYFAPAPAAPKEWRINVLVLDPAHPLADPNLYYQLDASILFEYNNRILQEAGISQQRINRYSAVTENQGTILGVEIGQPLSAEETAALMLLRGVSSFEAHGQSLPPADVMAQFHRNNPHVNRSSSPAADASPKTSQAADNSPQARLETISRNLRKLMADGVLPWTEEFIPFGVKLKDGDRVTVSLSNMTLKNPQHWIQIVRAVEGADEIYAAAGDITNEAVSELPAGVKVLILNHTRQFTDWQIIRRFHQLEELHIAFVDAGGPASMQARAELESVRDDEQGFKIDFDGSLLMRKYRIKAAAPSTVNEPAQARLEKVQRALQSLMDAGVLPWKKTDLKDSVFLKDGRVNVSLFMGSPENQQEWIQIAQATAGADEISVSRTNITNEAVNALPTELKVLSIENAPNFTDWQSIQRFRKLEKLFIRFPPDGKGAESQAQALAVFQTVTDGGFGFEIFNNGNQWPEKHRVKETAAAPKAQLPLDPQKPLADPNDYYGLDIIKLWRYNQKILAANGIPEAKINTKLSDDGHLFLHISSGLTKLDRNVLPQLRGIGEVYINSPEVSDYDLDQLTKNNPQIRQFDYAADLSPTTHVDGWQWLENLTNVVHLSLPPLANVGVEVLKFISSRKLESLSLFEVQEKCKPYLLRTVANEPGAFHFVHFMSNRAGEFTGQENEGFAVLAHLQAKPAPKETQPHVSQVLDPEAAYDLSFADRLAYNKTVIDRLNALATTSGASLSESFEGKLVLSVYGNPTLAQIELLASFRGIESIHMDAKDMQGIESLVTNNPRLYHLVFHLHESDSANLTRPWLASLKHLERLNILGMSKGRALFNLGANLKYLSQLPKLRTVELPGNKKDYPALKSAPAGADNVVEVSFGVGDETMSVVLSDTASPPASPEPSQAPDPEAAYEMSSQELLAWNNGVRNKILELNGTGNSAEVPEFFSSSPRTILLRGSWSAEQAALLKDFRGIMSVHIELNKTNALAEFAKNNPRIIVVDCLLSVIGFGQDLGLFNHFKNLRDLTIRSNQPDADNFADYLPSLADLPLKQLVLPGLFKDYERDLQPSNDDDAIKITFSVGHREGKFKIIAKKTQSEPSQAPDPEAAYTMDKTALMEWNHDVRDKILALNGKRKSDFTRVKVDLVGGKVYLEVEGVLSLGQVALLAEFRGVHAVNVRSDVAGFDEFAVNNPRIAIILHDVSKAVPGSKNLFWFDKLRHVEEIGLEKKSRSLSLDAGSIKAFASMGLKKLTVPLTQSECLPYLQRSDAVDAVLITFSDGKTEKYKIHSLEDARLEEDRRLTERELKELNGRAFFADNRKIMFDPATVTVNFVGFKIRHPEDWIFVLRALPAARRFAFDSSSEAFDYFEPANEGEPGAVLVVEFSQGDPFLKWMKLKPAIAPQEAKLEAPQPGSPAAIQKIVKEFLAMNIFYGDIHVSGIFARASVSFQDAEIRDPSRWRWALEQLAGARQFIFTDTQLEKMGEVEPLFFENADVADPGSIHIAMVHGKGVNSKTSPLGWKKFKPATPKPSNQFTAPDPVKAYQMSAAEITAYNAAIIHQLNVISERDRQVFVTSGNNLSIILHESAKAISDGQLELLKQLRGLELLSIKNTSAHALPHETMTQVARNNPRIESFMYVAPKTATNFKDFEIIQTLSWVRELRNVTDFGLIQYGAILEDVFDWIKDMPLEKFHSNLEPQNDTVAQYIEPAGDGEGFEYISDTIRGRYKLKSAASKQPAKQNGKPVLDTAKPLADPNAYYEYSTVERSDYNANILTGNNQGGHLLISYGGDGIIMLTVGRDATPSEIKKMMPLFRGIDGVLFESPQDSESLAVFAKNNPGMRILEYVPRPVNVRSWPEMPWLAEWKELQTVMFGQDVPLGNLRFIQSPRLTGLSLFEMPTVAELGPYAEKSEQGHPGAFELEYRNEGGFRGSYSGGHFVLKHLSPQSPTPAAKPPIDSVTKPEDFYAYSQQELYQYNMHVMSSSMASEMSLIFTNDHGPGAKGLKLFITSIGPREKAALPFLRGISTIFADDSLKKGSEGERFLLANNPRVKKVMRTDDEESAKEEKQPSPPTAQLDPEQAYKMDTGELEAYNQRIINQMKLEPSGGSPTFIMSQYIVPAPLGGGAGGKHVDRAGFALAISQALSDEQLQLLMQLRGIGQIIFLSQSITPRDMQTFVQNNPQLANITYAVNQAFPAHEWSWLANLKYTESLKIQGVSNNNYFPPVAINYLAAFIQNPLRSLSLPGEERDYLGHIKPYKEGAGEEKFIRINFTQGSTGSKLFTFGGNAQKPPLKDNLAGAQAPHLPAAVSWLDGKPIEEVYQLTPAKRLERNLQIIAKIKSEIAAGRMKNILPAFVSAPDFMPKNLFDANEEDGWLRINLGADGVTDWSFIRYFEGCDIAEVYEKTVIAEDVALLTLRNPGLENISISHSPQVTSNLSLALGGFSHLKELFGPRQEIKEQLERADKTDTAQVFRVRFDGADSDVLMKLKSRPDLQVYLELDAEAEAAHRIPATPQKEDVNQALARIKREIDSYKGSGDYISGDITAEKLPEGEIRVSFRKVKSKENIELSRFGSPHVTHWSFENSQMGAGHILETIPHSEKIIDLNLQGLGFSNTDDMTFLLARFKNLKSLNLSGIQLAFGFDLTKVPDALAQLPHLRMLFIDHGLLDDSMIQRHFVERAEGAAQQPNDLTVFLEDKKSELVGVRYWIRKTEGASSESAAAPQMDARARAAAYNERLKLLNTEGVETGQSFFMSRDDKVFLQVGSGVTRVASYDFLNKFEDVEGIFIDRASGLDEVQKILQVKSDFTAIEIQEEEQYDSIPDAKKKLVWVIDHLKQLNSVYFHKDVGGDGDLSEIIPHFNASRITTLELYEWRDAYSRAFLEKIAYSRWPLEHLIISGTMKVESQFINMFSGQLRTLSMTAHTELLKPIGTNLVQVESLTVSAHNLGIFMEKNMLNATATPKLRELVIAEEVDIDLVIADEIDIDLAVKVIERLPDLDALQFAKTIHDRFDQNAITAKFGEINNAWNAAVIKGNLYEITVNVKAMREAAPSELPKPAPTSASTSDSTSALSAEDRAAVYNAQLKTIKTKSPDSSADHFIFWAHDGRVFLKAQQALYVHSQRYNLDFLKEFPKIDGIVFDDNLDFSAGTLILGLRQDFDAIYLEDSDFTGRAYESDTIGRDYLITVLEKLSQTKALYFGGADYSPAFVQIVLNAIKGRPIQTLSLSSSFLNAAAGDTVVDNTEKFFESITPSLKKLELSFVSSNANARGLLRTLNAYFGGIQELTVQTRPDDLEGFRFNIKSVPNAEKITLVDIHLDSLADIESLGLHKLRQLKELTIDNRIGIERIDDINDYLPGLKKIAFKVNDISDAQQLKQSLLSHGRQFKILIDLVANAFGLHEVTIVFSETKPASPPSVASSASVSEKSAKEIAAEYNEKLAKMQLSGVALFKAEDGKVFLTIWQMYLASKFLPDLKRQFPMVEGLVLEDHFDYSAQENPKAVSFLLDAIKNSQLRAIKLDMTETTQKTIDKIKKIIDVMPNLDSLYFGEQSYDAKFLRGVFDAVRGRKIHSLGFDKTNLGGNFTDVVEKLIQNLRFPIKRLIIRTTEKTNVFGRMWIHEFANTLTELVIDKPSSSRVLRNPVDLPLLEKLDVDQGSAQFILPQLGKSGRELQSLALRIDNWADLDHAFLAEFEPHMAQVRNFELEFDYVARSDSSDFSAIQKLINGAQNMERFVIREGSRWDEIPFDLSAARNLKEMIINRQVETANILTILEQAPQLEKIVFQSSEISDTSMFAVWVSQKGGRINNGPGLEKTITFPSQESNKLIMVSRNHPVTVEALPPKEEIFDFETVDFVLGMVPPERREAVMAQVKEMFRLRGMAGAFEVFSKRYKNHQEKSGIARSELRDTSAPLTSEDHAAMILSLFKQTQISDSALLILDDETLGAMTEAQFNEYVALLGLNSKINLRVNRTKILSAQAQKRFDLLKRQFTDENRVDFFSGLRGNYKRVIFFGQHDRIAGYSEFLNKLPGNKKIIRAAYSTKNAGLPTLALLVPEDKIKSREEFFGEKEFRVMAEFAQQLMAELVIAFSA